MRASEALALRWADLHIEPANAAKLGYVHVRHRKSRFACRDAPLTERPRVMLKRHKSSSRSKWVFAEEETRPAQVSSLDHLHAELR